MPLHTAALIALATGFAIGWAVRSLFHSRTLAALRAEFTRNAQLASAHVQELETELRLVQDRVTAADLDVTRFRTEAQRVPSLEARASELQDQLIRAQAAQAAADTRTERIPALEEQIGDERRRAAELSDSVARLEQEKATLTVEVRQAGVRLAEQAALLDRAQVAFREAFQALSQDALKNNNQLFLDLAKSAFAELQTAARGDLDGRTQAVAQLVEPVRESLRKFESAVQELERNRLEAYAALKTEVVALSSGQKELNVETGKLVRALRAPVSRGRWGEFQLRRVIELAGMVEHCDFEEQRTIETEEGRLRPDVIIRLPGGKTSVVDAKVPLTAYLDALEQDDENARRILLRNHAANVKTHIAKLSSKAYWDQLPSNPDFVIMFVPVESAFAAALEQDPSLIDTAVESGVIPAGPMTLLTHLKAAAYGWRQELIADNAQRISDLGAELYDRVSNFLQHFVGVGRHLDRSMEAYNSAVGSLERRVLVTARQFKGLGAATGDDLPTPEQLTRLARHLQATEFDSTGPVESNGTDAAVSDHPSGGLGQDTADAPVEIRKSEET